MLAFSNDYYGFIFRVTQSVELFCTYHFEITFCGNSSFIFCYHSVITSGCQDTRPATVFLFCSLLFLTLLYISTQQKTPGNLAVPGYLTFGHNVPCGTQYILVSDYSMIVATRPDPTVRPPSRYFNIILPHIFYGFLSKIQ